jgi:hypothetical protein
MRVGEHNLGPPSDPRVLVLHGLRLKGFAPTETVADTVGIDAGRVGKQLAVLLAEGLVRQRDGRVSGFSLTAAGRVEHERLLAEELDGAGMRATVEHCYGRFLDQNEELLELCTAWQVRELDGAPAVNDHSDSDYDLAVIGRLARLDDRIQPVCAALGEALARLARYGPGLQTAREQVQAGDVTYFTAPMLPSYHAVWFELHEDLLVTLGLERTGKS